MRKKLFDCYVDLNCYRLAATQLYKSKQITKLDLRAVETEVAQAELTVTRQLKAANILPDKIYEKISRVQTISL